MSAMNNLGISIKRVFFGLLVRLPFKDKLRRFVLGLPFIEKVIQSETSRARARLSGFCAGNGADIGFGGDPITESAVRIDLEQPYTKSGAYPVQLQGDARKLKWFSDNVLDYVYSSHLLEDFDDTAPVLKEWLRVLRPAGKLILYCPDEKRYREHCRRTGQLMNVHHKHEDFSLEYVKALLEKIGSTRIIHENERADDYSWELVVEKTR